MKADIFFTVLLSGLSLLSCGSCSHRQKWERQHTSRLELTLGRNTSGAGTRSNVVNSFAARGKVKNIIVGVFKGGKVLTVQNLIDPNMRGINMLDCPLKDSSPYMDCTAVVLANILSSSAITALKNATTKADFLAVQSSLEITADTHPLPHQLLLFGPVVDARHGNSLIFSLVPGVTTSGLYVELNSMISEKQY